MIIEGFIHSLAPLLAIKGMLSLGGGQVRNRNATRNWI
jgi:hypothetical protein